VAWHGCGQFELKKTIPGSARLCSVILILPHYATLRYTGLPCDVHAICMTRLNGNCDFCNFCTCYLIHLVHSLKFHETQSAFLWLFCLFASFHYFLPSSLSSVASYNEIRISRLAWMKNEAVRFTIYHRQYIQFR
jgi:hypothetical protein